MTEYTLEKVNKKFWVRDSEGVLRYICSTKLECYNWIVKRRIAKINSESSSMFSRKTVKELNKIFMKEVIGK